jgi:hypothetical protein
MNAEMNFNTNRFVLIVILILFLLFAGSIVSAIDQSDDTVKFITAASKASSFIYPLKSTYYVPSTSNSFGYERFQTSGTTSFITSYKPKLLTVPSTTIAPVKYSIVGPWIFSSIKTTSKIQFNVDGTFEEHFSSPTNPYTAYGVWFAQGNNVFKLLITSKSSTNSRYQVGDTFTMIYDPVRNVIFDSSFPNSLYVPQIKSAFFPSPAMETAND